MTNGTLLCIGKMTVILSGFVSNTPLNISALIFMPPRMYVYIGTGTRMHTCYTDLMPSYLFESVPYVSEFRSVHSHTYYTDMMASYLFESVPYVSEFRSVHSHTYYTDMMASYLSEYEHTHAHTLHR